MPSTIRTFVAFAIAIAGAAVGDALFAAAGGAFAEDGEVGVVAVPAPPHAAIREIESRVRIRFMVIDNTTTTTDMPGCSDR
jgi:hypothetical protein